MRSIGNIHLAAAMMMSGMAVRRVEGEDVLIVDGDRADDVLRAISSGDAITVERRAPLAQSASKVHTHSREIARRLRQEARKAAKSSPDTQPSEVGP